jgi:transposase
MRRIKFQDDETGKVLIFLTNNFHLKATEIAQLYKHQWKIELFFKWIKQHLKIKSFWGHSENAVKTQVWIAVSVYVLIAIAKKKFMLHQSLYEILQIISISIFERIPINQLFQQTQLQYFKEQNHNQLKSGTNIKTLVNRNKIVLRAAAVVNNQKAYVDNSKLAA